MHVLATVQGLIMVKATFRVTQGRLAKYSVLDVGFFEEGRGQQTLIYTAPVQVSYRIIGQVGR